MVGLEAEALDRYPRQFSGGQRQRIAIARALAVEPAVLVADEPTSSLDVSVQKTVLELLSGLSAQMNLATLFISHDLSVIHAVCDHVAVLQGGRLVEVAPSGRFFTHPEHPYSRALLEAVPADREGGEVSALRRSRPCSTSRRCSRPRWWSWRASSPGRCGRSGSVVLCQAEAVTLLEAVASSVAGPGNRVLNVVTGPYGSLFGGWLRRTGAEVFDLVVGPSGLVGGLPSGRRCAGMDTVALTQAEAATGANLELAALLAVARESGVLTVVDAVAAIGAEPIAVDDWGIDVAVIGGQKALAGPAGVSAAVGQRAGLAAHREQPGRAAIVDAVPARLGRRLAAHRSLPDPRHPVGAGDPGAAGCAAPGARRGHRRGRAAAPSGAGRDAGRRGGAGPASVGCGGTPRGDLHDGGAACRGAPDLSSASCNPARCSPPATGRWPVSCSA